MTRFARQKAVPSILLHRWADFCSRLSWTRFVEIFSTGAFLFILAFASERIVSRCLFQPVQVVGTSMYPALYNSGSYWLNHYVYFERQPQRDDIVALKDPQDGALVVKRIIALPGESIFLDRGSVYVNGQKLNETYLPPHTPTYAYEKNENELIVCGLNQYFVLGDNRNNSTDSRTFGPVPRKDILGKIVE
jgi:signal peptidase I